MQSPEFKLQILPKKNPKPCAKVIHSDINTSGVYDKKKMRIPELVE
jgi:hypothetical protein